MGERKPDVLCAKACQHLSRQEYQLGLQCCDEILAGLPSPSNAPCCSSSATDHSVRLQVLLYRVYALVQLKKFTEAEENSSSVMCLQRELRPDTLKELLVSMLTDGCFRGMCQALFSCQPAEHMASCTAAGGSVETGGEGTRVERRWRIRDPPRGILSLDEYTLCFRFLRDGGCPLGDFCVSAHSHGELREWRERLVRRHLREPRTGAVACYGQQLLEKWTGNPLPHAVVAPSLLGVTVTCVPDLRQVVQKKNSSLCWMLQLHCDPPRVLRRVALLGELHRPLFSISEVATLTATGPRPYPLGPEPWEWTGPGHGAERVYQLKLRFSTHAYGNFQQAVALDLGSEPVLLQTVRVEQATPADVGLEPPCPPTRGSLMRWDVGCKQVTVVAFRPCDLSPLDRSLLQSYRIPAAADQLFTRSVLDHKVTPHNYRSRLHDLLYIEENAQYRLLCGFNLQTCLRLMTEPSAPGLRGEYGPLLAGQVFALLSLHETGTEPDSSAGRLVREAVSSMLLLAESGTAGRERVYEVRVEACGPEDMCLRLSEECCHDLRLQAGTDLQVELQFQLNRLPLCEMHFALDVIRDCALLFPEPPFPELPLRPESVDGWDSRLSERQRDALWAVMSAPSLPLPPILLCGPPASGKTFVLLEAVVLLLKADASRVLLCTRTEAAADSLVTELALAQGCLLRLWDRRQGSRQTEMPPQHAGAEASAPGMEEVKKSRLVVSTVRQAKQLVHLGLDSGFFTHILVDDASSIVECEVLMALSLASRSTRVVLAGDPHQPPPLMHSEFACERDLQRPLLERLCKLYPPDCGCMVWLTEQYRTQRHIVGLVSEVFYGGQLKAASSQPAHKDFFPLSFFVAWGAENSSCGYYNQAEVMEVADQLESLCKTWPVSWGKLDESSVGVLTPYPAQAVQLRSEARRRGLNCVTVHTLLAPAAPPFRVLFLSTVRTRASCRQGAPGRGVPGGAWHRGSLLEAEETTEDRELGFLSSPRALHSAMLRAQSLLAVVGDPVALCTVGKCRRIWEHFLRRCALEGGLHGALLSEVLEQIDAIEASRACVLNPLAPEFVPRMPPRRTPVQSPSTMVKRTPPWHPKPPSPSPRGHYGSMAPPAGPPYLVPLTSGRHCTYSRSLGAAGHLDSLRMSIPYSSGLLSPFPLSVAGQAVMAYNLGLLRSPRAPPAALPQFLHSSPMLCRNSVDDVPNCARAGRSDSHTALGALQLWGEAENCKQARTDNIFSPRWSCPPSPPHVCRSSTPKSCGSQPPFSPENSPISSNHSRFGLAGRSPSVGPCHSLCSSPSAWDAGHANVRDSVRRPLGDTLRYPQRSEHLGSQLHSPPFHDMHAPPVPSHSKPIGPLTQSTMGSLAALESLENPAPCGDIRGPGARNVFSWKNLLQHPTHPPQNPMVPPSINTIASLHPHRMGPCPSLSPCCPLLEADIISSRFDLACTFQNVPPEQQSWPPADPYSSARPQHPGHMQEGGRRLYQRCSTRLHPPGGSHQSQISLDSASKDSISLSICSAWEETVGERAAVSSPVCLPADPGDVCSQEVPLQMASKTTGVPNGLEQGFDSLSLLPEMYHDGDKGDSAYHSNVQ
ncbi:probable helicase with zinc finger domain isoform X2 [Paramormyrops kingsleyae]|uniref:probable helicase with zinc finger domain isoform X2 n=1 Tax=Paramormyrops kingsleyae TaxID=1676925 RepID=UPI003B970EFD